MNRRRSTVASLAAVVLTAGLSASALAAEAAEPEPVGVFGIEGMTWLLTGQAVDGAMVAVPDGIVVSLLMEDGRASGTGGCNSYFGTYELDGFAVSFSKIGSTLMACPGAAGDVEAAYFGNLGLVASYQSGGIQMAFLDADGEVLLEYDLAPEVGIVGSWLAQGINNQVGGVVSSQTTSAITANFGDDGRLTGNDGCNDYFTSYMTEGDRISIAPEIGSTKMACLSDELAEQSRWYFAALAAATTWATDVNGSLELRDDDGALQVRYEPAAS
jgi:heat shock protein HslJ